MNTQGISQTPRLTKSRALKISPSASRGSVALAERTGSFSIPGRMRRRVMPQIFILRHYLETRAPQPVRPRSLLTMLLMEFQRSRDPSQTLMTQPLWTHLLHEGKSMRLILRFMRLTSWRYTSVAHLALLHRTVRRLGPSTGP